MNFLMPGKSPIITELKRAVVATIGALLYAVGVNLFIVPLGLYNGGLMGYCQLIRTLLVEHAHMSIPFDIAGILYFIVNIPIIIMAWIKLDKMFVFRAVVNTAMVTLFLSVIPTKPILSGDMITNCLVGGVIAGIGTGISLWAATPGGGTDLIGLMLIKKKEGFSVGKLNLLVDSILYLICLLLFNAQTAIYSIVYSVICTVVIDRLHQQNINVQATIVTDVPAEKLKENLITKVKRGFTEFSAKGGYSGTDKKAYLVVVSKYELPELIEAVNECDNNAFVTLHEGTKIYGNFEKRL